MTSPGHSPPADAVAHAGVAPQASVVRGTDLRDAPQVPVAIVGAGACGLVAALRLKAAGHDCVVLERDRQPGGSTALSSGFIPAAATRAQRALGIDDSGETFRADIQAKAGGQAAAHLVTAYTTAVAQALDALEQHHALEFEVLDGFLYPGHSVRRMHAVPERSGEALMARLGAAAARAGVDVLTDAHVHRLHLAANGRMAGLDFRRPDGRDERLACDALLLACNGFGGSRAMVAQWIPEMAGAVFGGHQGNDGSAIAWGRELGASLADLGGYQGHGSWAVPHNVLISWALMMAGGIQVNSRGERFHDETDGYSEAAVRVLAQPGGIAWTIIDDGLLALARTFPDFNAAQAAGAVKTATDIAALARLLDCPEPVLVRTLADMCPDAGAARGPPATPDPTPAPTPDRPPAKWPDAALLTGVARRADPPGSTDPATRRFDRALRAPYHAIRVTGALFHTQGGLDIDARCRVRRSDGSVFPNLLAAGGAARGVSGNAVWGYLSGNGLLSAVAGGWIAAGTIASWLRTRAR